MKNWQRFLLCLAIIAAILGFSAVYNHWESGKKQKGVVNYPLA